MADQYGSDFISIVDDEGNEFELTGYDLLAKVPIDPEVASYVDKGWIETVKVDYFDGAVEKIIEKTKK